MSQENLIKILMGYDWFHIFMLSIMFFVICILILTICEYYARRSPLVGYGSRLELLARESLMLERELELMGRKVRKYYHGRARFLSLSQKKEYNRISDEFVVCRMDFILIRGFYPYAAWLRLFSRNKKSIFYQK